MLAKLSIVCFYDRNLGDLQSPMLFILTFERQRNTQVHFVAGCEGTEGGKRFASCWRRASWWLQLLLRLPSQAVNQHTPGGLYFLCVCPVSVRVVSGDKVAEGIEQKHSCDCWWVLCCYAIVQVVYILLPPGSINGAAWPLILAKFTSLSIPNRQVAAPLQYWKHPSSSLSPALCRGALSLLQPLMWQAGSSLALAGFRR